MSSNNSLSIPSSQLLNLIQHHLTESGLTETSKTLLLETNVGSRGLLSHAHANLLKCVKNGDWGNVLDTLSGITLDDGSNSNGMTDNDIDTIERKMIQRRQTDLNNVLGHVHEMAILELGDAGEMDLAFATLKICRGILDRADVNANTGDGNGHGNGNGNENGNENGGEDSQQYLVKDRSLSQSVERKLHSISALRSVRATAAAHSGNHNHHSMSGVETDIHMVLPPDYYGINGTTKEKRRNELAKRLGGIIPILPSSRLISLCQQAIKWQIHTGEMPMVKNLWQEGDDDDDNDNGNDDADGDDDDKKKRKKKQRNKKKRKFDLVLGEVDVEIASRDILMSSSSRNNRSSSKKRNVSYESIPLDPWSVIKFAKKTTVTSCAFYIDANNDNDEGMMKNGGSRCSLITGTSDGFIEIWDPDSKYTSLRMDLEYQKNDDIMCHDEDETVGNGNGNGKEAVAPSILAMTVNADGTMLATGDSKGSIYIWSIANGQCLMDLKAHTGSAITCLDFSRDGEASSRILSSSQDGTCREFGLRAKRMLKEFRGHTSFVNSCAYVLKNNKSGGSSSSSSSSLSSDRALELLVVTASADGTVRVWCGRSAEIKYILNPSTTTSSNPSAIVSLSSSGGAGGSHSGDLGQNIHTVIPLHTPSNAMIVVPRGQTIYLMTYNGIVLRKFVNDGISKAEEGQVHVESNNEYEREEFVTATVSPSNKWLYGVTNSGVCLCFDMSTGKVEQSIRDFASETAGGKPKIEVSGIAHHPLKGILAAFSSSPAQKRGLLTLWK